MGILTGVYMGSVGTPLRVSLQDQPSGPTTPRPRMASGLASTVEIGTEIIRPLIDFSQVGDPKFSSAGATTALPGQLSWRVARLRPCVGTAQKYSLPHWRSEKSKFYC